MSGKKKDAAPSLLASDAQLIFFNTTEIAEAAGMPRPLLHGLMEDWEAVFWKLARERADELGLADIDDALAALGIALIRLTEYDKIADEHGLYRVLNLPYCLAFSDCDAFKSYCSAENQKKLRQFLLGRGAQSRESEENRFKLIKLEAFQETDKAKRDDNQRQWAADLIFAPPASMLLQ